MSPHSTSPTSRERWPRRGPSRWPPGSGQTSTPGVPLQGHSDPQSQRSFVAHQPAHPSPVAMPVWALPKHTRASHRCPSAPQGLAPPGLPSCTSRAPRTWNSSSTCVNPGSNDRYRRLSHWSPHCPRVPPPGRLFSMPHLSCSPRPGQPGLRLSGAWWVSLICFFLGACAPPPPTRTRLCRSGLIINSQACDSPFS